MSGQLVGEVIAAPAGPGRAMTPTQRRVWRKRVFGHSELTASQKLVLLALETFADYPEGTNARPGVALLAKTCDLGIRVVEGTLTRGRELELIEQTARANPKRGHAACYRLISTRTDMQVEDSSTRTTVQVETDFQPAETDFQPAQTDVSTRTLVQPTNPEHQLISPIGDGAQQQAAEDIADELLEATITDRRPRQIFKRLRKEVIALLEEGMDPDILTEAARRWNERPEAGPGLLPWLYTDVLKERRCSQERYEADAEQDRRTFIRDAIDDCTDCDVYGRLSNLDDCPKHPNFRTKQGVTT